MVLQTDHYHLSGHCYILLPRKLTILMMKQEGTRALGRSPEEKVKGQGEAIIFL